MPILQMRRLRLRALAKVPQCDTANECQDLNLTHDPFADPLSLRRQYHYPVWSPQMGGWGNSALDPFLQCDRLHTAKWFSSNIQKIVFEEKHNPLKIESNWSNAPICPSMYLFI